MALSASFQATIDLVDPTVVLASIEDEPGYGYFEFSYSCSGSIYTIRGGSFVACEHGAVHLLEAMGFMFLSPNPTFWRRNGAAIASGTLPTNLSRTKTQFWMPSTSYSQTYGNSFSGQVVSWSGGTVGSWRATLDNADNKFYDLIGWRHQPFPSGHRWASVVSAFPAYFSANPQTLLPNPNSFALATMSPTDYDTVATLCASFLLKQGLSTISSLYKYHRTEFDPADGDPNDSDHVFAFTVLVCQKVRAGTPPIEGNPSYSGVSDAQLGVYAYAGHKAVPSFDVRPYVYVGVALGFSPPSVFASRMEDHAGNSVAILARDYLGTHTWTNGQPLIDGKSKSTYPDTYDAYYAVGCIGMQGGDGSGNWLVNLVSTRHLNMKLRTGSYTFAQALSDVVDGLFDGDQAVADLYTYWMDPNETIHRFSLYESMLIVDQMVDGWYKTLFEQVLTINYEFMFLPDRPTSPAIGDAYDLALTKLLKHTTAMVFDQVIHSYGYLRRLGANYTISRYPHLYYGNGDLTDPIKAIYYTDAQKPTHAEYLAAKAALAPLVARADGLDDGNLMVMHNVRPSWLSTTKATAFRTESTTTVAYVGPGTLTRSGVVFEDDGGDGYIEVPEIEPTPLPAGLSELEARGKYVFTWDTGVAFLRLFPTNRLKQLNAGSNYGDVFAYIPGRCANDAAAENSARFRFIDQIGICDVTPSTMRDDTRMNTLGPGVIKIDAINTDGIGMLTNMLPWVSADPNKQLIPVDIVAEDFPVRGVINKV